jgi:hypothetical protein
MKAASAIMIAADNSTCFAACAIFIFLSPVLQTFHKRAIIEYHPPVKRDESGIRDYDEDDVNWIQFIKCMRSAGLSFTGGISPILS